MKSQTGVTLIELAIAMAILGVLATLSFAGYESSIQNANLRIMREAASKLALSQQQHRQTYGRYASSVKESGKANSTTLVFTDVNRYTVSVSNADFRTFTATLTPKTRSLQTKPQCSRMQVSSTQGYLSYGTQNASGKNTSSECLPNG